MKPKYASSTAKVFISHSHSDRAVATELQRVLTKFGAETYLDQDKIQVADVLPDRISQGIAWCNSFLLLWSSSAVASEWVNREWNTAYELRKKIIPYCLDSTPLPPLLENLVYVDQKDAQVSHAGLLRAVFGKTFTPSATELFPGRWRVTMNVFGFGTATHDLDLRPNGQITGKAKIDTGGILDNLLRNQGMSDLLKIQPSISGTWEYDEHTETLTLSMITPGFGQEYRETIMVRMTGREVGEIHGKDLSGRTYVIKRLPGPELKNSLLQLDKALAHFASVEMTSATFQKEIDKVMASIDALREHRDLVVQLGDNTLCGHFDKICSMGPGFKQVLESDGRLAAKKLSTKLVAEAIRRTYLEKLLGGCFPDE